MKISFDSVVRVVQPDNSIVERAMNVDGTFYDMEMPGDQSLSEFSLDILDDDGLSFMDAVEEQCQDSPTDGSYFFDKSGYVYLLSSLLNETTLISLFQQL